MLGSRRVDFVFYKSFYHVRNNAPLLSPSLRLSKPEALRARLRPGRAHAPEGGIYPV